MKITKLQISLVPAIGGCNRLSIFWRDADTRQSFIVDSICFREEVPALELAQIFRNVAKLIERVEENENDSGH